MMSRGKNAPSSNHGEVYGGPASRSKPTVGSLNSGNQRPPLIGGGNSVIGAGYNSKQSYLANPGNNNNLGSGSSGGPGNPAS